MLVQSSLPSSIEAALSFVSDHGKPDLLCDWMPDAETWQKCPNSDEHPRDGCTNSVSTREEKGSGDDSYSLTQSRSCFQLSTVSTMCASSAPNFVYKRRNLQRNSVALFSAQAATNTDRNGGCLPFIHSEGTSPAAEKEDHVDSQIKPVIDDVKDPVIPPDLCNGDLVSGDVSICQQFYPQKLDDVPCTQIDYSRSLDVISKAEYIIGCSAGEEHRFDETPSINVCKSALEYYSVNDSCSSSKSNMELGKVSTKIEVDDTGECSSSDILALEVLAEDYSEKELCISILRNHGLLEGVLPVRSCASSEVLGIDGDSNCFLSCKICGHTENPLNMLICDHCEEAFHISCCNPKVKKIPVDEWYCQPCLKKKRKLESAAGKSSNIRSEVSECRNRTSKGESGSISLMLKDSMPYTSDVRIGKAFQAEVPDWSGPVSNDVDYVGELLEVDPAGCISLHGWSSNRSFTHDSIGNWLQCREVLYDNTSSEGTICGKWRRAPLFEVQTDDWDCSCAVLWDPIHADCAVPQELGTDQVLTHLKYIELLRPRLASKKRKAELHQE